MESVMERFEEWAHLRQPAQHAASTQERPQEDHMTKLAEARDAISAIADNPLIDAIAEAGIGKWMSPAEIQALVALYRDLENGRKLRAAGPPKIDLSQQAPAQQQDTRDLTPQKIV